MSDKINMIHPAGAGKSQKPAGMIGGKPPAQGSGEALTTATPAMSGEIQALCCQKNAADSGVSPFQKMYLEVARNNVLAQCNNGVKNGTESVSPGKGTAKTENADQAGNANLFAILQAEMLTVSIDSGDRSVLDLQKILGTAPDDLMQQASAIIAEAIQKISQALSMKVQDGLENLNMANPSQAIIEQFAEMISALKGIASLLDQAVAMNQPIECKNLAFDVPKAAGVGQVIHTELFKIELALKMTGISGEVMSAVAQKENAPVLTGILQASDPSKMSMPAMHVRQVLGDLLVTKEQKVQALLTQLSQSLQQKGIGDSSVLLESITSTAKGADASKMPVIGALDSPVLRKLLNIDAVNASVKSNQEAALQNDKLDLPKATKVHFTKDLSLLLSQTKPQEQGPAVYADGQVKVMGGTQALFGQGKAPDMLAPHHFEESVMNQLADKMNVVLKSGITELRIMLRPESLGEVHLKIRLDGDVVMGKMYVENQQVKHIIESHMNVLKDSLAQHNLQTGTFDVNVNHGNGSRDQMQAMADMAAHAGHGESGGHGQGMVGGTKEEEAEKQMENGIETGRRFGSNTIEYFA
jgi:flagellar hook-length control protein FliK